MSVSALFAWMAEIASGRVVFGAPDRENGMWSNVTYRGDDGSTLVLFFDGDEFDYVDSITLPDGTPIPHEFLFYLYIDRNDFWLRAVQLPSDCLAIWTRQIDEATR